MGGSMPPRGGEYNGNGSNNNASRPPPFERNGWGAPTNNTPMISHPPPNIMASNGLNQGPLQSPGGLGTQNGGIAGGKTTTQVTIPKDVSSSEGFGKSCGQVWSKRGREGGFGLNLSVEKVLSRGIFIIQNHISETRLR
jgi:hypothetical protein